MENGMKITATPTDTNRDHARAVFTWTEDGENCDFAAFGIEDAELETLITAKVHEGADLEGWKVVIA